MTTPLGDGAITVTMVVAYASLGLVGYLVYRLGSLWFDRWIGAVAAAIVLTRAPFLSNGLRAYVDLPYIALCLGALAIETKRPRAGWPVLALLVPAGLLRPEAWLFSVAYLALAGASPRRTGPDGPRTRGIGRMAGRRLGGGARRGTRRLAAWRWPRRSSGCCSTRSPPAALYSFTGTRETVETLKRQTGPVDLVLYGPRRLGEVLQWPGMVGALAGVVLGFAFLRRRSALGIAAAVLALGAFALLACAGLAIIARYTMLAGAVLAIFVALALLGWRLLEPGHPWRRRWQLFAGLVALMFVVWLPQPVGPRLQGRHRPHQPGDDRARPHRPGRRRRLRAALRPDRGPQPPRRPPPRLRPRSQADRDRQRQRAAAAPPRLLPRPRPAPS